MVCSKVKLPLIVMSNEYKHSYMLFVDKESYTSVGNMCSELMRMQNVYSVCKEEEEG
jgi:hypothetical protein